MELWVDVHILLVLSSSFCFKKCLGYIVFGLFLFFYVWDFIHLIEIVCLYLFGFDICCFVSFV